MHRTRRKSDGESLREARRNDDACVAECCLEVRADGTRNTEKQAEKARTHANDGASDGKYDEDGTKKRKDKRQKRRQRIGEKR